MINIIDEFKKYKIDITNRTAKTRYMLSKDIGNWLLYAGFELEISENEATVIWNNYHNIGKYLICESREDSSTRLFIRNVTNILEDSFKKEGWWNTFTVTKTPTNKGLWLAKVVEYRLDRNGFLNLEVEPMLPVDDIKFHTLFDSKDNGTWNSIAWWVMIVRSEAFLDEYNFNTFNLHKPNFKALKERFTELEELDEYEIGKVLLKKYLSDEISLEDMESCLNKPSEWEQLVLDIQKAIASKTIESTYGEKYPLFVNKIENNVIRNGYVHIELINNYLKRQIEYYDELVTSGKISPISGDVLDIVEVALSYRKSLKDREKAIKKEKRKNKSL